MRNQTIRPAVTLCLLLSLGLSGAFAQKAPLEIDIDAIRKKMKDGITPVALQGFTGESLSVLRFDLEALGCEIVDEGGAAYLISGKNSDTLEGRVFDRLNKNNQILAKRYKGGSARVQAHTFSDAIVDKIIGPGMGIARTKIVFKVDTGRAKELYITDYDGHNPVRVTSDNTIVAAPTWAPGKLALYYTSYMRQNPDIYFHDLSTGRRQSIARYSGLNTSPAVSPGGNKVAMILSKGGSPDVYVSDSNGQNLKRLTSTRGDESSPCWSPDGQRICFVSRESGRARLYTIPAYGGKMSQLRTAGVSTVTEPDWAPDGKTIAFTSQYRGGFNICTIPAKGGTATVVAGGEDPSWSGNSRTLIITRRIGGKRVLSLLDAKTKRVKDIRKNFAGSCSQASWAK